VEIGEGGGDLVNQLGELYERGGAPPDDLSQTVLMLDALADESGNERIISEAARQGCSLGAIPDDLAPQDFALAVWLEQPALVHVCHRKKVLHRVERFYEFRSSDSRRLDVRSLESKASEMATALALWFDSRRRGRKCDIAVYGEGDKIRLSVAHGGLYRADVAVNDAPGCTRIAYRPQQRDAIIYDVTTGALRIRADFPAERDAYRKELGRVFYHDPEYFLCVGIYTLRPLRTNRGVLARIHGMCGVRLTEACIDVDGWPGSQEILKGDDLALRIAGCDARDGAPGEIVRACFSIDHCDGGERRLEVRLPNIAEFDARNDEPVVEAFMRANGFTTAGAYGLGFDRLVDAA